MAYLEDKSLVLNEINQFYEREEKNGIKTQRVERI
jgi:hypothetical protein